MWALSWRSLSSQSPDLQTEPLNRRQSVHGLMDTEVTTVVDETTGHKRGGEMCSLQPKKVICTWLLEKQKVAEGKIKEKEQRNNPAWSGACRQLRASGVPVA